MYVGPEFFWLSVHMSFDPSRPLGRPQGLINYEDTKTKCRLYWCLIEFIDWRYSQSCWNFRPCFVNYSPSNLLSGSPSNPFSWKFLRKDDLIGIGVGPLYSVSFASMYYIKHRSLPAIRQKNASSHSLAITKDTERRAQVRSICSIEKTWTEPQVKLGLYAPCFFENFTIAFKIYNY
jgi:hypothetical protein